MKKRLMSYVILCAALCAVLLIIGAGCSSKGGGQEKIRVVVYDRGTDGGRTNPTSNQWTDWIKAKLLEDENIVIEFEPVPRAREEEAQVNLMAAGNPPDLMMTYSIDNINNWGDQGGLFDVSPYINTTLKNLKEFLGPDPALPGRDLIQRNQNNQTGQIFSIPGRRMNVARLNTFMRKDWLDKLGLPVPKTKEEFYDTLAAFKEQDPGGVGRNRVIPYIMNEDVRWSAGNILESFIDPNMSHRDRWVNVVVERYNLLPNYKEGIRFLNRMYNAGLIDRDFPLYRDDDILNNHIRSGAVGAFGHNWDQVFRESERLLSDLRKNVPDAEWIALDCMTNSEGVPQRMSYDPAGIFYFIPKSSKHPDAAMRYLNWLAKYENYHFIQTGPEGIVHTYVDGVPKLNPQAGDGWIQNSALNIDYTPIMNGLFLETEDESIRAIAAAYPWPAQMVMAAYHTALNNAKPGPVIIPASPLTAAGPLNQTLQDKSKAFVIQAIVAPSADFDRVWDTNVADWLSSGAEVVRKERADKYIAP